MKKTICYLLLLCAALFIGGTNIASAKGDFEIAPISLTKADLKPELTFTDLDCNFGEDITAITHTNATGRPDFSITTSPKFTPEPKYQLTWMRTNPGVKPYKFIDDLTFVGVPLFVAGIIAKSEKKSFRQNTPDNKHTLLTDFKTRIDDYSQFFGPVVTTGLKIGGVEGRSDWGRYLASTAMSYGIMASLVNSIKYSAKEMRPDGSTANSWPSGHTATAFVGATLLHKEYGMTRSP